jgi:hypothetical protein
MRDIFYTPPFPAPNATTTLQVMKYMLNFIMVCVQLNWQFFRFDMMLSMVSLLKAIAILKGFNFIFQTTQTCRNHFNHVFIVGGPKC